MVSQEAKLEFFYDVISPYTYLAWQTLKQYSTIWDIRVVLRPVFLGGIMKGSNNRPPAVVLNKGRFMQEDLRLLAAAPNQKIREKLTDSAFKAVWEDKSLRDAQNNLAQINDEFLRGICTTAGLDETDTKKLFEDAKTIGKAELTDTTSEALEVSQVGCRFEDFRLQKYNAFGAPTIVVHVCGKPHMFFGSDRWEHIAFLLNKDYYGINPARKTPNSRL
ncbi:Glutathione S-transferase kappa, putative [Perkinsus marinus ATCC 50983]|uniref:Glutathione S-transferase kappa, putative n=1 Tax=Perkinsus marinus (strain ATCC 50983 / TXsc) TaxID=423536 RepID=C5LWY1_PERM5|nr:Glutathione S-transferase kappa, putative [Perkinsus marinus ATCC 50983]EEQ98759.1 Glutathione S-transferase kappa, putative [Perkinsus marinus ATCC 50983]|eukprot:XP_002766042.1 Glutathione S-transferase kappa, putative [Perkinsus marinus ATCC 50983]